MGGNELTILGWLTEKARNRETDYYSYVAPMVGLHHRSPAFHRMLDNISRREHALNRPLLSAVVVLKGRGVPGEGFFRLAAELDYPLDPHEVQHRYAFWREYIEWVFHYWSNQG